MVFQMSLNTCVEPVKCTPAKSRLAKTVSLIMAASPKTTLITPSGSPASLKMSMMIFAEKTWLSLGFQRTTLPIMAALAGRLAAIAVKLKGVMAYTNPSSGRYSSRFQTPESDLGWSLYICVMKATLYLKKSINSQEASISA